MKIKGKGKGGKRGSGRKGRKREEGKCEGGRRGKGRGGTEEEEEEEGKWGRKERR